MNINIINWAVLPCSPHDSRVCLLGLKKKVEYNQYGMGFWHEVINEKEFMLAVVKYGIIFEVIKNV